ncbi:pickpocket protein 28-like [Anopheles nili]|uniref:pickpocket protein 28-like n=1 Tax=Anopheles nili TaxID=185578 RepID=UPI00237B04F7|nr:pickpocket protein 28-like [Anopheles nili]
MVPVVPIKLYSDRAEKFKRPNQLAMEATKMQKTPNAVMSILEDYCINSSIHGFKYFVGSKRTIAEKIWWISMCILSIYGCGSLIKTVFDKWRRDPVVVTFAEKPTPIYDIPFPAVTICPVTKAKSSQLNFTAVYQRAIHEGLKDTDITDEEFDRFVAMLQVCDFGFSEYFTNQSYDDNVVEMLRDLAIPFEEQFLMCTWRGHYVNCSDLFSPTLTESGVCYTFNGLSSNDLMKQEEFHRNYEHVGEQRSSENWTMEEGYRPNVGMDTYPRRLVSAGGHSGLLVLLKSDQHDMDYLCGISAQGIRVPMNQSLTVRIEPFLITTSANVQEYNPSKRLCYYTHERHLRYFRIYTKRNCELECLTNFTLHMCGCVLFAMPHTADVRICGIGMQDCCDEAETILQEEGLGEPTLSVSRELLRECNCLPACTYLQYNAEISQASFEWRRLISTVHLLERELEHSDLTTLSVYYREAQFISIKRSQLFGLNDFIANCGGILGLFMGVSLLSIVEILYYFTIKPLVEHFLRWRRRRNASKTTLVVPYAAGVGYTSAFDKFLRDVA